MPGFILQVPAASGKAQRNGIKTGKGRDTAGIRRVLVKIPWK
jgi:hypothetical protein